MVVLGDIPQDPLTPEAREKIAEFVKLGGGLLVLGGSYAYGGGNWKDSPLEPLLPITVGKPLDLKPNEGSAKVELIGTGIKHLGKIEEPLGIVPWWNDVQLRPEAEVWLTAGKHPFAVVSKAGEGRVMAILAGVVGEAPEGQAAFWDSPGWEEFLKRCLLYLARGERD